MRRAPHKVHAGSSQARVRATATRPWTATVLRTAAGPHRNHGRPSDRALAAAAAAPRGDPASAGTRRHAAGTAKT
jgi:hypothetical protein